MTESVGTVEDGSHRCCDWRSSPDKPADDAGSAPEPPAPPSLGMFESSPDLKEKHGRSFCPFRTKIWS